jgi:hypothetical protein
MSTTRKLKQERPNRKSSPRKRDVRPNGVAQKHPRRLSVGDSTSTSTISADGEGRRRYLTAALFFCPRLADSLSFAAFRPGFFRHSGGSSSPSIGGFPCPARSRIRRVSARSALPPLSRKYSSVRKAETFSATAISCCISTFIVTTSYNASAAYFVLRS